MGISAAFCVEKSQIQTGTPTMTIGSDTSDIHMINIALTAADGSGQVWQDPTQMIPLGMNGNPEAFVAAIKDNLPLVNNLRVMFNEYSFNADGSMNPQFERFLAAATAAGYQLTICYGGGDNQRIGLGDADHPRARRWRWSGRRGWG